MADKLGHDGLYKAQAAQTPSISELTELAQELGLHCKDGELEHLQEHMEETLAGSYQIVNDLVAPTLPVKYPRVPGYRPEPEDNQCNAWYWKCNIEGAPEGKLKGKTFGIKDNTCVAGVPMMNGSKIMEGFVPDIDATIVTRILDAGGRILGKTNCEHMCFSGSSWTNDTGPTLNPHDKSRSTGGSSGGSAAAVYNGDVDMAVGGDQGGSIRIPASWCGIVGHKPTWGLVPYTGALPIEITCDHLGPMARNVRDCALLLEVIAGYDEGRDSRQPRDLEVPKYTELLDGKLDGWKIGLVTEGFTGCDSDVQSVVREAAQQLIKAGAQVEDVSVPMHTHGVAIWSPICTEGAYQCMVRGVGAGYHYKGYYGESIMTKLSHGYKMEAKQLSEPMKLVCMFGKYIEKVYGNRFYGRAQNLNMKLTKAYDEALSKYDVLVMPTLPYKAPLLPKKDCTLPERLKNALGMLKNTAPFDSTGHPALTLNAGKSEGLPIGMMIVGKQFEDAKVLQAAFAFEQLQKK
ncbi:amidase-like [Mercenaria mercenaria]|uniref:amidase-like n=1 Tax=Mercenaria mercenaria TaxID=6596 RepID=UPI001E1D88C2|nr:amidase-like [Mercenaria mercenaria]